MAFSKSSLPLLLGPFFNKSDELHIFGAPFINYFIMICESMLSVSQDGLLREICCYQNIDYRYLIIYNIYIYIYIYTISNTSSFEINWVFFGGGQNYPPYKTLGWGLFPAASYALCGH